MYILAEARTNFIDNQHIIISYTLHHDAYSIQYSPDFKARMFDMDCCNKTVSVITCTQGCSKCLPMSAPDIINIFSIYTTHNFLWSII